MRLSVAAGGRSHVLHTDKRSRITHDSMRNGEREISANGVRGVGKSGCRKNPDDVGHYTLLPLALPPVTDAASTTVEATAIGNLAYAIMATSRFPFPSLFPSPQLCM